MKYTKDEPCEFCPFRKDSRAGSLGATSPKAIVQQVLTEVHLPCHMTVNYTDPAWEHKLYNEGSVVEHCVGARACAANTHLVPQDSVLKYMQDNLKPIAKDQCFDAKQFIQHHNNARVIKSWTIQKTPMPNKPKVTRIMKSFSRSEDNATIVGK